MVRRFVEHQQARLDHEEAREVGAHDPATAHLPGGTIEILGRITESAEHLFRLGLDLGIVQRVEFRLGLVVGTGFDLAGLLHRLQFVLELLDRAGAARRDL